MKIRQLPDWSGSCLTKIRQRPGWSGCCVIKIRQLPDQSGHCLMKTRQLPDIFHANLMLNRSHGLKDFLCILQIDISVDAYRGTAGS